MKAPCFSLQGAEMAAAACAGRALRPNGRSQTGACTGRLKRPDALSLVLPGCWLAPEAGDHFHLCMAANHVCIAEAELPWQLAHQKPHQHLIGYMQKRSSFGANNGSCASAALSSACRW